MAPHTFYGMITMNHCYDDLIGEVATTTVSARPEVPDATTYIRPLAEARHNKNPGGHFKLAWYASRLRRSRY